MLPQTGSPSLRIPRILVIAAEQPLRDFCREGLPWSGCAIEFVRDLADAITSGFDPDVVVVDVPLGGGRRKLFEHLCEYAEAIGCSVIALTDDFELLRRASRRKVQFVLWPCPPEALWDALAVAIAGGPDSQGDLEDQGDSDREDKESVLKKT
jgi:hypothetical protein